MCSSDIMFAGAGVYGEAEESQTVNIDYTVPYDLCLTGAVLMVKGAKFEDTVSLKVVHPVAGVLATFVNGWFVVEDSQKQFELELSYPANIAAGLIIRATYAATAEVGLRDVAINYMLHKVLV